MPRTKLHSIDKLRSELVKPVKAIDDIDENLNSLIKLQDTIIELILYYNKKVAKRNSVIKDAEEVLINEVQSKMNGIEHELDIRFEKDVNFAYDLPVELQEVELVIKDNRF